MTDEEAEEIEEEIFVSEIREREVQTFGSSGVHIESEGKATIEGRMELRRDSNENDFEFEDDEELDIEEEDIYLSDGLDENDKVYREPFFLINIFVFLFYL